ncbi:MAG: D-alanine--D-alanine ligase [Parcubacteria group bacterium]|nr:D-alanine--D-alanine ligase [Parcubacteria group bacterium]
MSKKLKIGVLMGGPSAEREISLLTGKAICKNLDKKKYQVLPIEMTKKGELLADKQYFLEKNKLPLELGSKVLIPTLQSDLNKSKEGVDLVFIAMHGPIGEDGCIQGMLESMGIPYTGSGVLPSVLAMNKAKSAEIYKQNGLLTPDYFDFTKKEWQKSRGEIIKKIKTKIKIPIIIKPVDQGSSVGIYLVKQEKDLANAVDSSFLTSNWIMAQEFIDGDESTCGILEKNGEPFATPVTKIIANKGDFYDLASKYDDGGSTHICPAPFNKNITKKIQEIALKAHRILGCRGMSRTDVFVSKDKKLYVIETNTIPGMTSVSLLPEAAGKMGIDFFEMLDLIIKASIK